MAKARRILVTFLGRGHRTPGREGYSQATYDFGGGDTETARVFGVALMRHLRKSGAPPDVLVIAGTSGSDWDIFYEELGLIAEGAADRDAAFEEAVALSDATKRDSVSAAEAAPLAARLGNALSVGCRCAVIPYGLDRTGQVEILRGLAEEVSPGDRVVLDLTHGLRHLPVLGLVAALYLKAAKRAEVEAIFYGALDLSFRHAQRHAPVLRLDGLLDIAAWIQALQTFDKDGDYGVFAPLLDKDGVAEEALSGLRRAAFFERISRIGDARAALATFRDNAGDLSALQGATALLAESLAERLAWATARGHHIRQAELARLHLAHGDYMRAAVFGLEGFTTRLVSEAGGDPSRLADRDAAVDAFVRAADRAQFGGGPPDEAARALIDRARAFHALNAFRNAVVHVGQPRGGEATEALRSARRATNALTRWFAALLPEPFG
jgi:CRISPR-associated Csx2 family protein